MKSSQPLPILLSRLWGHIPQRRRGQLFFLLALMIFTAFAEIFSIGAVLPFLGVFTDPSKIFEYPRAQPFINALGLTGPGQLLLPLAIIFSLAALVAGTMRLMLLWGITRISYATGSDVSLSIYRRTLYQPYEVHAARNSSEVISGISTKANIVTNTIVMVLNLISSSVILIAIFVMLLAIDPMIALMALCGFGLIYTFIIQVTRKRLQRDSQHIASEATRVIKALQEGLGSIRDVLIDGSQSFYCKIYGDSDRILRRAIGNSSFVSQSPRFIVEALGMMLIAFLALILSRQPGGLTDAIPILGALALGAQRLLPVLQQVYSSWSSILSGQNSLEDALGLLDQPLPEFLDNPSNIPVIFKREIRLSDVEFSYNSQGPRILSNINISITKGSRIGFIGVTGSGKSTLLDIVMGLLMPTMGHLEVDGRIITKSNCRGWQAHIAHVPQNIYLSDGTIEENIALGVPKDQIDKDRVRSAAYQAQIAELIEAWPMQYRTEVGERGIRLSGGQRQRIGIARALYKQADVIIFDEATSALDNETESLVMQTIESLNTELTILIIAHRITTLRNCSRIVELGNGGILNVSSYEGLVTRL